MPARVGLTDLPLLTSLNGDERLTAIAYPGGSAQASQMPISLLEQEFRNTYIAQTALQVVPLSAFGVTGDGSTTDGNRIRTAVETAAAEKLALWFPPSPDSTGWKMAADPGWKIENKSDFALLGAPGSFLAKLTGDFRNIELHGCSNVLVDGLSTKATFAGGGGIDLIGCTNIAFRRMRNSLGRGFRLYDGTSNLLIEDVHWTEPTGAGIQFGESNVHPAGDPITDALVRRCRFVGSRQEGLEFQNKPQRILVDDCQFIDCNTVGLEEVFDVGGGECEDITFRDVLIDNTGSLSAYSAVIACGIRIKVEYSLTPQRIRVIRPTIRMPANAVAETFGIACEAAGYEIIGGEITGDVGYGLSLGGNGIGLVDGIRLIGQRTFGVRVRSNARATLRNIRAEPQSTGTSIVADSAAWADVDGEFIGGTNGLHFNTTATDCRASGTFRNQSGYAFRASSNAARAAFRNISVSGAAKVAELRGDRQQIVGLTAEGTGSIGVEVVTGANLCSVVGATIEGFTSNLTDNGTLTEVAGNVTA